MQTDPGMPSRTLFMLAMISARRDKGEGKKWDFNDSTSVKSTVLSLFTQLVLSTSFPRSGPYLFYAAYVFGRIVVRSASARRAIG